MPDQVCPEVAALVARVVASAEWVFSRHRMSAAEERDVRAKAERGEIGQVFPAAAVDGVDRSALANLVARAAQVEAGEIPADPNPKAMTNIWRQKDRRRWKGHFKHPGCGKAISILYHVEHKVKIERLRQL